MTLSYRILHVEDSPDDSELVRRALRNAPFAVIYVRVETEEDYLAHLDSGIPDVVLCDYDLPRFSAERALQIIHGRNLDTPFIVVSNHIGENAVLAMQQGASDYLPKSTLGRLSKAIAQAIERRNARAESAKAQEELRVSESMKRSILNSLAARIATIDAQGVILETNKAWDEFAPARVEVGLRPAFVGDNYFDLLRIRAESGSSDAAEMLAGMRAVIARQQKFFSLEYEMNMGAAKRWFYVRAFPLEGSAHGAVVSHRDVTDRMISHVALDQANKRLQMLSKRVLNVQEEERRRISRELHDDIGQSLIALKIGLHRLAQEVPAAQGALVTECVGVADTTLDKLRHLALDLRPPQLDQLGLGDALGWLAQQQRTMTGLDIQCNASGLENRRPPAALEIACYRIAQEALSNATRHAKAKSIVVKVDSDGRLLKLTIRDDGVGFDEPSAQQRSLKSGGLGLISMEERAELAGGRLKVRSVLGGGTTLNVIFPLVVADPHPVRVAAAA